MRRVRDEFCVPARDGDLFLLRQGMLRIDDEGDRVGVDGDGVETCVSGETKECRTRRLARGADRDLAGEGSLYGNADLGKSRRNSSRTGKSRGRCTRWLR